MLVDIAIVLGVAIAGLTIVWALFSSVTAAPAKDAAAPVATKAKASKKAKPSKKEAAEERAIEALIAKEAVSKNSKGMSSDGHKVESLEEARERKAKKSGKGQTVQAEAREFSETQKMKEKAEGFRVVEKTVEKKVASPVTNTAPSMSKREEMEKKLGQFFKSNNKRGKRAGNDDYKPPSKQETETDKGGKVILKKQFETADPSGLWHRDREW